MPALIAVPLDQPDRAANADEEVSGCVQRAKELVDFARHQGYRLDELVEIIEDVG